MDTWRSAQITGNLLEVPGIGPAAVRMLAEGDVGVDKITNTFQVRMGLIDTTGGRTRVHANY
jgi:hypothetical protein